jgi:transglutaminase-like putative cysteine protease/MFS family permease
MTRTDAVDATAPVPDRVGAAPTFTRALAGCAAVAALSVVLVGAAAQAASALFDSPWFWAAFLPCLAFAAAWAVVTAWFEHRDASGDTAGLLGVLAGAVVSAVFVLRIGWADTLLLGVLPTGQTFSVLRQEIAALGTTIAQETPPITASAGVVASTSVVLILALALTLLLARSLEQPTLAGAPALTLIVIGAVVTAGVTPLPAMLLAACAWMGLMWLAHPTRMPRTALGSAGTAALALVALLAAGAMLPQLTSGLLPEGQRWTSGQAVVGPQLATEVNLGEDLRQAPGETGILLTTEDGSGRYLRTGVVEDPMASTWHLGRPEQGAAPARGEIAFPQPALPQTTDQVTVTLDRFAPDWVPVTNGAQRVPAAEDTWVPMLQDTVIARPNPTRLSGGLTLVDSAIAAGPEDMPAHLEQATGTDQEPPAPNRLTDQERSELRGSELARTAEEVMGGAATDWDKANALQAWLRSDEFDYSTTTPVDDGYDGSGLAMTEQFLQARSGYCVHFASAFALMAESQGLPTRIVIGYAPEDGRAGQPTAIPTNRAHAWPEVYFRGVGWIAFEPTAGVAGAPDYTDPNAGAGTQPSEPATPSESATPSPSEASPSSAEPASPSPSSSPSEASPSPSEQAGQQPEESGPGAADVLRVLGIVLGVLLLLALVAAAVFGPAWWRRRRRQRRLQGPWEGEDQDRARVLAAWAEVRDTAARSGVRPDATSTEASTAAAWGALVPEHGEEMDTVRRAAQWARYAPSASPAPADPAAVSAAAGAVVVAMDEARSQRKSTQDKDV